MIQVPTPQWNRIPFLCHLTFTASGHEQGDIVQVGNHFHNETFPQHHRHSQLRATNENEKSLSEKISHFISEMNIFSY